MFAEGDPQLAGDEKKRKRMLSNRESAKRSRMRKQQQLHDLTSQISEFKCQNDQLLLQTNMLTQQNMLLDSNNIILRYELNSLKERLQFLNSTIRMMEQISGISIDVLMAPDPFLMPWQLPCPSQSIMANDGTFQL
ncbi:bZIP transcription factor 53-like [Curcuma longa]|uniref:bZIP transcription factor 53-like n=1 Tax=Curcuma longa TaxID=136217 RepID=UPI003D9EF4E1